MRTTGDFLVRIESSASASLAVAASLNVSAAGTTFTFEPLFEVPAAAGGAKLGAAQRKSVWHRARAGGTTVGSAWDAAHQIVQRTNTAFAATGANVTYIEPDLIQEWPAERSLFTGLGVGEDTFRDESNEGGKYVFPEPRTFAWHLTDGFSGLISARVDAKNNKTWDVRIAHLDVGYDLHHATLPAGFDPALSKNVTGDGRGERDVRDLVREGLAKNPGHGTGTVGILAGGQLSFQNPKYKAFDDQIGAAPDARIVGVRVGESVVQIRTSCVAEAIAYVADLCKSEDTRVHVLSMSMGGVASQAWADAVNLAYERGVILVTAAGNNFSTGLGGFPTTSTVYPARFERVLSACGVMGNNKPYYGLKLGTMQGNWGPRSKEQTTLSAFTPNTPWARHSHDNPENVKIVDMDGAGTSSATPQIAGAAALYLQKYGATLFDSSKYPQPWMRVEAVRAALIQSANQNFAKGDREKLGSGTLQADAALKVAPVAASKLKQSPKADASFSFFHTLFGLGATGAGIEPMLQLEMAQLVQQWEPGDPSDPATKRGNPFDALLAEADKGGLSHARQRELAEMLLQHPRASTYLKKTLAQMLGAKPPSGGGGAVPTSTPAVSSPPRQPTRFDPETPKFRALRGYALDPSFAVSLATRQVSETVFEVPWDSKLKPGPCDEYVQVIDVDPSSRAVYEPVDLNHPNLLAMQGLAPSEGTPQFHQQMVYAVTRMTIDNFEAALGRKVLWRPGPPPAGEDEKDDSTYVQRLRIYPHAFRGANAFYSPDKISLLFGYFNSRGLPGRGNGGCPQLIFTCLSQDIVAHETTHALLDGMHRKYLTSTNPDVLAFHEAFADIVALLQRLGLPELLRHQIALTQGQVRNRRSLVGELATQFGQATGEHGGLREAIGTYDEARNWKAVEPTGNEYNEQQEPHARGSILVAAVFDAFLSIYEGRTEDLVRIATNGTGVLQLGAIHPDLVARLADEATKAASHVLRMCVRALDYCPPTDITFGEYLRALITADFDLVPNDDLGYRVAFIEAFRKRGIPVDDIRTLSVESLLWRRECDEPQRLSREFCNRLWKFREDADAHAFTIDREKIFHIQRKARAKIHDEIEEHFKTAAPGPDDARILGMDPGYGFEVHTARFAARIGPDGQLLTQAIIVLLQEDRKRPIGGANFEGGCAIVADLSTGSVRYIIRKSVTSTTRFDRQKEFGLAMARSGDNQPYFRTGKKDEPFAALHAKGGM